MFAKRTRSWNPYILGSKIPLLLLLNIISLKKIIKFIVNLQQQHAKDSKIAHFMIKSVYFVR